MLFIEYAEQLLKDYEAKKSANLLSTLLLDPTTAQLKKACSHVYAERMKKGEKVETNTLIAFFGVPPKGKDISYIIERTAADKFRPLQSFMKGRVKIPSSENVELLAWLIDFNPRPYNRAQAVSLEAADALSKGLKKDESGKDAISAEENIVTEKDKNIVLPNLPLKNDSKPKLNQTFKWAAAIVLMMVVVFGGMYFTANKKQPYGNIYTGECMTWVNDHYEKVPCSTKRDRNRIIVPLDNEMMSTFKKITREDTITASSIGNIYYIKMQGEPEFYTRSGYHPIEVNRPLKVLSQHIYKTYLKYKKSTNKELSSK